MFAEMGDGRKNVGYIRKFDVIRLVAVAGGGRGAGRFSGRWQLKTDAVFVRNVAINKAHYAVKRPQRRT